MDSVDSYDNEENYEEEENRGGYSGPKKGNVLPLWGNERSMNLNPLILTNIQSSHYFKVNLYELKTYHEVIDEIYYKVQHLEPWEKGSRKTAGQTGMCGGVRGVGAGGIVSTAYCLLYKLFTLKLTRKQVNGLVNHPDSPYIRALGFMYIRYTQPPADLWDWYDEYLEDPEELDVKAGGGQVMTMGNILRNFLCKLEWFSTLFPRIPVPIQQKLQTKMAARFPSAVPAAGSAPARGRTAPVAAAAQGRHIPDSELHFGEAQKIARMRPTPARSEEEHKPYSRERDVDRGAQNSRDRDRERPNNLERDRVISRDRVDSKDRDRLVRERDRDVCRDKDRIISREGDRSRERDRTTSNRDRDVRGGSERSGLSRERDRSSYVRDREVSGNNRNADRRGASEKRGYSREREKRGGSKEKTYSRQERPFVKRLSPVRRRHDDGRKADHSPVRRRYDDGRKADQRYRH